MTEFWTWVCNNLGISCPVLLLFLITFIQITPIKINPWTAIKDFFTTPYKILKTAEKTSEELNNVKKDLENLKKEVNKIGESTDKAQQESQHRSVLITGKIEKLQDDINEFKLQVKNDGEQQKAEECRIRILKFGDEITHGVIHSKEHYEQTLSDIGYYDNYCKTHPEFPNHITVINSQIINDKYKQLFYSVEAPKEEE